MDPSSDAALLRGQDAGAFGRLVAEHQRTVLGLAQSLGLHGADADDAAAETFAQVFRALPGFEGRAALGTWVYQIAVRTLRRYRAKRGRRAKFERNAAEDAPEPADARGLSPEAASSERETQQKLWAAVAKLEPRQAMAVELCYRRGWPLEQIAETMRCPVGTIKTLLFRARDELRRKLKPEEMST